MKRLKRTPGQTDVRLNSSTRQLASDPRSQTAEPQNNKCDVAASCPHSILVKRLECCADRLNPPHYFDISWNLGVQVALALLFVGALWLLLWLGASLFELIKIDVLRELIKK